MDFKKHIGDVVLLYSFVCFSLTLDPGFGNPGSQYSAGFASTTGQPFGQGYIMTDGRGGAAYGPGYADRGSVFVSFSLFLFLSRVLSLSCSLSQIVLLLIYTIGMQQRMFENFNVAAAAGYNGQTDPRSFMAPPLAPNGASYG